MSLNKDMHPRNPYNKGVDFKALASEFPEFRKYCTLKNNGEVDLNFDEDAAVRCLAKLLLKKDFGLNVVLPLGSLVPRIPQKMNYCLIIDDLLKINNIAENGNAVGIDIGTGASCVYGLLGAKYFGWNFVATEGDVVSARVAHENVVRNGLSEKILVVEVNPKAKTVLMDMMNNIGADKSYSFCMCNPPFFEIEERNNRYTKEPSLGGERYSNRVVLEERSQPHSATFASSAELETEGGEVAFVNRIIDDSIILRDKVKIYTSMLGKKQSVKDLKTRLDRLRNDIKFFWTTLNQGKTQRWIVAWTFDKDIVWTKADRPIRVCCAKPGLVRMEQTMRKLDAIVRRESNKSTVFECRRITWTHQRARKRAEERLAMELDVNQSSIKRVKLSSIDAATQTCLGTGDGRDSLTDAGNKEGSWIFPTNSKNLADFQVQAYSPRSNPESTTTKNYLLQFRVICSPNPENQKSEDRLTIELITGSKQHLHQILQYFRNSLIPRTS